MLRKIRFSSLSVGDKFQWMSKIFTKSAEQRAYCGSPYNDFIFQKGDIVIIEESDTPIPFEQEDEDYYVYRDSYFDWHGYP